MDDMLSTQQQLFVAEYIKHRHGTDAALVAGYSPDSVHDILNNPAIQRAIRDLETATAERVSVEADFIIRRLAEIASADATDYVEEDERTGELRRKSLKKVPRAANAVTFRRNRYGEQEVQFKLSDPLRALELLGKSLGLYHDVVRQEVITDRDREEKAARLEFMRSKMEGNAPE